MMNRRENMLAIMNHQPHDHVGNFMIDIYSVGGNNETFECGPFGGGLDGFGCKALLSVITDYKIRAAERVIHYFKPDSICAFDDFATERGPFMSPANWIA